MSRWLVLAALLGGCGGAAPRAELVRAPPTAKEPEAPVAYCVDLHRSRLTVVAKALGGHYPVKVSRWRGRVILDRGRAVRLTVRADLKSIDAGSEMLTDLVLSARVLDVEHHPEARFESLSVEPKAGEQVRVVGRLSLRGHTRTVAIPVQVERSRRSLRAEARFTIDRTDFGIRPGGVLGWALSNDLEIRIRGRARECQTGSPGMVGE
ncbi:MAG: YceI family protein [Myxococcales bacterium]|nr:YceI family protein [Myxococcales bacterium]MCB9578117.1 YceI family protein [Polyangiaceae bacterium]